MDSIDLSQQTNKTNTIEKVKHVRYRLDSAEIPKWRTNIRKDFDILNRPYLFDCVNTTIQTNFLLIEEKRWYDSLIISTIFEFVHTAILILYTKKEYRYSIWKIIWQLKKLIDVNATLFSWRFLTKDVRQVFLKFIYYYV